MAKLIGDNGYTTERLDEATYILVTEESDIEEFEELYYKGETEYRDIDRLGLYKFVNNKYKRIFFLDEAIDFAKSILED